MAYAQAAGGAAEPAVGEQRHVGAHALAVDEGGDAEHLAHPGAAAGALIPDHEHVAALVAPVAHGRQRLFFRLEHPRRAAMHQRGQSGRLEQRPIRAQVAGEHGHAAVCGAGVGDGAHDLTIGRRSVLELLRQRASGVREAIAVQCARLQQRAQDYAGATHVVEVAGQKTTARLQVGNERRAGEYRRHVVEVKANTGLVGDRRQVKRSVRRTAGG